MVECQDGWRATRSVGRRGRLQRGKGGKSQSQGRDVEGWRSGRLERGRVKSMEPREGDAEGRIKKGWKVRNSTGPRGIGGRSVRKLHRCEKGSPNISGSLVASHV
jgi:hypothetical protein